KIYLKYVIHPSSIGFRRGLLVHCVYILQISIYYQNLGNRSVDEFVQNFPELSESQVQISKEDIEKEILNQTQFQ
ncbi:MAG: hypothetical protein WCP39_05140, partial [Chlamydiota bacterium]